MAKKKNKKEEKKKFEYSNEVVGIILILASIIGIGAYGPAGGFIRSFAVFLVGNIYIFLLLGVLILGGYLILKRKMPDFGSLRWIGFYIIVISFLILLHMKYIILNEQEGSKIITETFNNLLVAFKSISAISNSGGGMIGAIFTFMFYSLFRDGTKIVVITLIVIGVILLFNTSIIDLFKKIKLPKREKKEKNTCKNDDEEDERIHISSTKDIEKVSEKEAIVDREIPIKTSSDVSTPKVEEVEKPTINLNYKLPPISLLKLSKGNNDKENVESVKQNIATLERVLGDFEIPGKIKECHIGPSVTQYELELKAGTKVNKLLSIQKEIALNLAAKDVRIQAPIPGKSTIGIELPNKVNSAVSFREILSKLPEPNEKSILAVGLGKDIMGSVKWAEINATPHLLIAGATGSGKSVCINCIIASILMRTRPDEVKLVMVDPKKVELSMYNGVPHLLTPVVTDPKKASIALKNIVREMERRYQIFEDTKCKNIGAYNKMCETNTDYVKMPYIVFIIDELADLMLVAAKDVEDSIMRITQMARAAGIHLIVATQRPSTDVITGVVKANIPSRISFAVSSVFPPPVLPGLHSLHLPSAVSYKLRYIFLHTALLTAHTPIVRQNRYRCRSQFLSPPDALLGNVPMHLDVSSSSLPVPLLLLVLQCPLETDGTYLSVHLPASYGQGRQYRLHILPPDSYSQEVEHKSCIVFHCLPVPSGSSFPGCHRFPVKTHTLPAPAHPFQQKQRYGVGRSHKGFPAVHSNPVPHPGFPFGSNISAPGKNCRWVKAGKSSS